MIEFFRNIPFFRSLFYFWSALKDQWHMNIFGYLRSLIWYFKDIITFLNLKTNSQAKISLSTLYPYLSDKTTITHIEPTYFYQDTWAAGKIFNAKPKKHFDIASNVKSMAIIAQAIPITLVDIRPVELPVRNFTFIEGTILDLPFKDNSIESLSCLCVVEHIGLGRYGDQLDSFGTEKAVKELQRVVKKGGNLYISVPIDKENKVYFNAHRSFTPEYFLSLFPNMILKEERYIYGKELVKKYDREKGFGTGLFHLQKK